MTDKPDKSYTITFSIADAEVAYTITLARLIELTTNHPDVILKDVAYGKAVQLRTRSWDTLKGSPAFKKLGPARKKDKAAAAPNVETF